MHPVDLVSRTAAGDILLVPPREYPREKFLTNIWKTGNLLRSLGVHGGSLVAITADPTPESVLTFFGASLLDARVRFAPPASIDARVIVGPTEHIDQFELPPGGQYLGYGTEPADPSWSYFGRDVWSENPTFPDVEHDADAVLLETARIQYDSESVMNAAHDVAESYRADDVVALRSSLARPGSVVAGILAPLIADATILFPGQDDVGTVAVTANEADVPESRIVDSKQVDIQGEAV